VPVAVALASSATGSGTSESSLFRWNELINSAVFFKEKMVSLPPRRDKLHYTFDNSSLENIGRANFNLLMRLNSIATRPAVFASSGRGSVGKSSSSSSRPIHRSRAEIEREKQAREIDRDNAILLKKLQTTKSAVIQNINTTGRGAGASLGGPSRSPGSSPGSSRRPEWVDPMDHRGIQAVDRYPRMSVGKSGPPQHRDSRDIAMEASREDYLYDVAPPDATRR
jgi:hypothetical protein